HYPVLAIRMLIQSVIAGAVVFGAMSAILRQRKALALTGVTLALLATLLGGGSAPLPVDIDTKFGIGFDWFLLDLLVMTIVFVPVERFWPRHPTQKTFRPEWTTDATYFIITHLPAQLVTFLMVLPGVFAVKWFSIPQLMQTVGGLSLWVQLPLTILVADLGQYFVHRMFHQVPFLWRFHAVHHSIQTMDWIAGSRSHFFDIVITRGLIMIPLALCGFSQAALAGYLIFVSFHATFSHTDFRPRWIWMEPYFVTVRYHHWHHAADKNAADVNFAIHFPFIDRLFGTYHLPKDAWPEKYGLINATMPKGWLSQFVSPFVSA
ncbi:MAG TPA: sterol desaturase family protein, partial [Bryobacteraceae bacterium]|nr:sterol desaturase family protein [Bryobacteraceae bacterium]